MCIALPARVVALHGEDVELELHGGERVTASSTLHPDVSVGDYVLMDRGLVLSVIDETEAEALIAMFEEIGQMMNEAEASYA